MKGRLFFLIVSLALLFGIAVWTIYERPEENLIPIEMEELDTTSSDTEDTANETTGDSSLETASIDSSLDAEGYEVQESEESLPEEYEEEVPLENPGTTIEISKLDSVMKEQQGLYAFEHMEERLQTLYCEIYHILVHLNTKIAISTTSVDDMDMAFRCVLMDHPEIFYVKGYTYTKYTQGDIIKKILFSGTYSKTSEEVEINQSQIEQYVLVCLASMPQGLDEYGKVKYVYEYIIEHTDYNLNAAENQNICSVFIYGQSVCQGYAKAFQYIMNELSIECTLVVGTVTSGEGHAWNLVRMDGDYYYVDATWGDAFYHFSGEAETAAGVTTPSITYDYLGITTEQILYTHSIGSVVAMPVCTAMQDNYYVRENAYFEQMDNEKMANLFHNAYASGKNYVTLKCATRLAFDDIFNQMLTNSQVFGFLQNSTNSVAYSTNETQLTISFWI